MPKNSLFFQYQKLERNSFKEAVYHLFYIFSKEYNTIYTELLHYLDFYYYTDEYVFSDTKYIVYVFDCNHRYIARIALLDFKFEYNMDSIINLLYEEISNYVPNENSSFYLYLAIT
jgi:hypothetical protein